MCSVCDCNHILIMEVKFYTYKERVYYRHCLLSRLNELRGKIRESNYHKREAMNVYVSPGVRLILKSQAFAAAFRIHLRYTQ